MARRSSPTTRPGPSSRRAPRWPTASRTRAPTWRRSSAASRASAVLRFDHLDAEALPARVVRAVRGLHEALERQGRAVRVEYVAAPVLGHELGRRRADQRLAGGPAVELAVPRVVRLPLALDPVGPGGGDGPAQVLDRRGLARRVA